VTLSRLYVCLFSLHECLSCTHPASWLPESNKYHVKKLHTYISHKAKKSSNIAASVS